MMRSNDKELEDYLNEDLGDFERQKDQARADPNPLAGHELYHVREERKAKLHLASSPPVKLYVCKIPDGLTQQGLRNLFNQFGEIREVIGPLFSGQGQSLLKFAFVAFNSRREALAAIEGVSERPPLFLEVRFSWDEQEAHRKRLMEEEVEKFTSKVPLPTSDGWAGAGDEEEEEDWEKEIEEEQKMNDLVDRFMENGIDDESDSELFGVG